MTVANILEYLLILTCHGKVISNVYSKLVKFIRILYTIRPKLPADVLRMIYFAFVYSYLTYGVQYCCKPFVSPHLPYMPQCCIYLGHSASHNSSATHTHTHV